MNAEQLNNGTHYWSESSQQFVPIAWMAIPHAENALAKLVAAHGDEVRETPLGQALLARIAKAGEMTDQASLAGDDTRLLRDATSGRYTGAVRINRRKR